MLRAWAIDLQSHKNLPLMPINGVLSVYYISRMSHVGLGPQLPYLQSVRSLEVDLTGTTLRTRPSPSHTRRQSCSSLEHGGGATSTDCFAS